MRMLELSGTYKEMGHAFGEERRVGIQKLYALRVQNAIFQAKHYGGKTVTENELLAISEASLPITKRFHPEGLEELEGIAEGSGLSLVKVLAMNGLTDFRDVLSWGAPIDNGGCTAAMVHEDSSDSGPLCGQSWDLATDNLPHVLGVKRKPYGGPQTITMTTDGCLSLIGMNEHGLSIGTTNIRMKDARPGVCYLSVIHKALSKTNFDEALEVIKTAPRAGGHFYYLAAPDGRIAMVECTAEKAHVAFLESGTAAHTNHVLVEEHLPLEGVKPSPSSLHRQARMESLLKGQSPLNPPILQSFFADEDGKINAICRDDFNGINTNGAVIMSPREKRIDLVHGLPRAMAWETHYL